MEALGRGRSHASPTSASGDRRREEAVGAESGEDSARDPSVDRGADASENTKSTWMRRSDAARVLGLSKTSVHRKAVSGELPMRVDAGVKLYKVSAGAARTMLAARRADAEEATCAAIVRAALEGDDALSIVTKLACPPKLVTKTLSELREAQRIGDLFADERRRADARRRLRAGDPNVAVLQCTLCGDGSARFCGGCAASRDEARRKRRPMHTTD